MNKLSLWISQLLLLLCLMTTQQAYAALVDIMVNQTDSPDPVPSGGTLTYTINVANNGPDDATGVVLTDTIPASSTFVSRSTTKGTCSGTTTVTCNIGALANGESATVTIVVTAPTTAGTISNTADATRNEPDSNALNDSDTDATTVSVSANMSITKTDSADPVLQGQNYTYTLTPRNNGPQSLTATDTLTVVDNIPLGMRLRALPTGTGWSCSSSGGASFPQNGPVNVTCTKTAALAITTASTIAVSVLATSTGTLVNQASVSSTMADNNTSNNTVTQSTTINQAANLTIGKTTPSNTGAGGTYAYTITPQLIVGDTTGGTITITDNLPNNINVVSNPVITGSSGVWSCGYFVPPALTVPVTIPFLVSAGSPATLVCTSSTAYTNSATTTATLASIAFNYQPQVGGTLINSATIAVSGVTDPVAGNNTASATTTVTASSDLQVSKTSTNTDAMLLGTAFNYNVAFWNLGPGAIPTGTTVTLTEQLPAGITITAIPTPAGWTCPTPPIVGGSTFTCTRSGLAVTSGTLVFTATSTTTGTKTNIASISSPLADPNSANNTSADVIDIFTTGGGGGTYQDVSMTKDDIGAGGTYGPDPVAISGLVKYRLRILNRGPSNMPTGRVITINDYVPFNATVMSVTPVTAGQLWTCTTIPVGGVVGPTTITCTRTVDDGVAARRFRVSNTNDIDIVLRADTGTSINNQADVATTNDPVSSNNLDSEATAILSDANLSLTKTVSAPSVFFGTNYTYTFTVTNNGTNPVPAGATGAIRLTDDMRPNPDANHISNTAVINGWTCTTSGTGGADPLLCDYSGGLAVGASTSFTVTVTPRTVGLARANTASVAFMPTAIVADPDLSDNSSTVLIDVLPSANLQVSKLASRTTVAVGQDLSYVITTLNNGPNTATNTKMIDTLPANVDVRSITATGGGVCVQNTPAAGQIQCTWATLASGASQAVTVVVRPTSLAVSPIVNSATVSSDVTDNTPANNTSTVSVTLIPAVIDLIINKVDLQDPVAQFSTATYLVTVSNQGPSVATNVVVTENLPFTYLTYQSATPSQGTCNPPVSNVMTCNLGNLEAGASATITIVMDAPIVGTDTNTVSVTATETDTNLANNSVSENTTVQLGADLSFSKLATPDPVIAGNAVFYYLKVKNNGPANASNTVITDTLPVGIVFNSYTASQGSCNHTAGVVTCNLGLLLNSGTAQVTLVATAMVGGVQSNTATASSSTPDPNPVDNTDTADVSVIDGIIRGRVFADNGLGGGTANNGLQNGGELGIGNVIVKLTDCGATDYVFAQTDGSGDYQLIVPALLATGAVLCVVETNLSGYRNTGGSAGTTAGTYNITTDKTQFTYTDGVTYTGVNFGDVAQSQLFTDGNQQSEPNTAVNYAHTFIAGSDGKVSFSTSTLATPNSLFWSNVLYKDSNCNGLLDVGEPTIAGQYTVHAGDTICLINKQFVPSNATQGAMNVVTLSSSFVYDTLAPTVTEVLTRTDTTTVGLTSTLVLHKAVDKVSALPGETITYTITYSNNGTQAISNIVVNDSVPAFTHSPIATCVMPLPTNLTLCTPSILYPAIKWNMTGTLAPSQQGQVRFNVTLDN
ncbi:MAG: DUF11 domain-containing protein [Moraxellaceae bacterium]|nr:DUF11 domain-containing protein [Moraxellaceae bacterium]